MLLTVLCYRPIKVRDSNTSIEGRRSMPIQLQCSCGRNLRLLDTLEGKQIRCPDCKSIILVPRNNASGMMNDQRTKPPSRGKAQVSAPLLPHGQVKKLKPPKDVPSEEWSSESDTQLPMPPRRRRTSTRNTNQVQSAFSLRLLFAAFCGFIVVAGAATLILTVVVRRAPELQTDAWNPDTVTSTKTDSSIPSTDSSMKTVRIGTCEIDIPPTIELKDADIVSDLAMIMSVADFKYTSGAKYYKLSVFDVTIKPTASQNHPVIRAGTARQLFEAVTSRSDIVEPETTHQIGGKTFSRFVLKTTHNGEDRRRITYICRSGSHIYQIQYTCEVPVDMTQKNEAHDAFEATIRTLRIN